MDRERQSYADDSDAALLAMKPEADTISDLCRALSMRARTARAIALTGQPCPTLRAEEAAEEAAARVWIKMHDKIAATRATTLAGIRFKARFSPTPWLDPVMMQLIVLDLLALA